MSEHGAKLDRAAEVLVERITERTPMAQGEELHELTQALEIIRKWVPASAPRTYVQKSH